MADPKSDFVKAVHEAVNKLNEFLDNLKLEDHFQSAVFEENEEEYLRKLFVYHSFCIRTIKERIGDADCSSSELQVSSSVVFKMAMALLSMRDMAERISEEIENYRTEGLIENILLILESPLIAFEDLDPFGLKHIPDPAEMEEEEEPSSKRMKL